MMTRARRFGLAHLAAIVFGALPSVHTRMGETVQSFSLYSLLAQGAAAQSLRALSPWIAFLLCAAAGATFIVRRAVSLRSRRLAIAITIAALLAFISETLLIFAGHEQRMAVLLPPVTFRAGLGLWCILALEVLALRLAWNLPREDSSR